MRKITFWKQDKLKTKEFKNDKKLYKFLNKHSIHMFYMNGMTYAYVGGIK